MREGKPYQSKRWLGLPPAKQADVVLEASVVVVLVGMTASVMEETSVVGMALVAAATVKDTVAVGWLQWIW